MGGRGWGIYLDGAIGFHLFEAAVSFTFCFVIFMYTVLSMFSCGCSRADLTPSMLYAVSWLM